MYVWWKLKSPSYFLLFSASFHLVPTPTRISPANSWIKVLLHISIIEECTSRSARFSSELASSSRKGLFLVLWLQWEIMFLRDFSFLYQYRRLHYYKKSKIKMGMSNLGQKQTLSLSKSSFSNCFTLFRLWRIISLCILSVSSATKNIITYKKRQTKHLSKRKYCEKTFFSSLFWDSV